MLLLQLAIGGVMIILNVALHAIGFDFIIKKLYVLVPKFTVTFKHHWKTAVIIWSTIATFGIIILDVWLWAILYRLVGALPDFETALYFSLTCFTTLGMGDVLLDDKWRLLSGIEASIGFFLFGWTTAFIFEIITKIYRHEMKE